MSIIISLSKLINVDAVKLLCDEYASEIIVDEAETLNEKCTFSYVKIEEPNDAQISSVMVKEVDYDSNLNEIDVSHVITSVNFVSSHVLRLPNDVFSKFKNLKAINCDGVNLQMLSYDDLNGAVNLEEFSCNSNYIKSLNASLFKGSEKLKVLDLSINDIESIDEASLSGLMQLIKLFLYDNKLKELPRTAFNDLIKLEEVNLSNNQIEIIPEQLFLNCKELKYIYLNDNQIHHLTDSSLVGIENVAFLEISNNLLTSLKLNISASALYANNNQLESVHLNSIGYLSFYNNFISKMTFQNEHHVLSLNISKNMFNSTSLNDDIRLLSQVKTLDLSFNDLGPLAVSTFLDLNELKILNLQATNLTRIEYGLFAHQMKLEQIDLSYNQMGAIEISKLSPMKALTTLFIEGNNLTELDYRNMKKTLPKLKTIGYSDNSWTCSYLTEMNAFVESNEIEIYHSMTVKTRSNVGGIACNDDKKANVEMKYEDKSLPTNGIRHKLKSSDNELTVISKKFEEILQHISNTSSSLSTSTSSHDAVSKRELINELSLIKSRIAMFGENLTSIVKRLDKLPTTQEILNEAVRFIIRNRTDADMEIMRKKLHEDLGNLLNKSSRYYMEMEEIQDEKAINPTTAIIRDDFLTKVMVSIIFVIVCGFTAIYVIKLYAQRHDNRNILTYMNADTINENIL